METINRFRPQLAVSIYHKVDHIWDLPIFLMSRLPEYHFFIDIYSFERFEIILYCVPFERPVPTLRAGRDRGATLRPPGPRHVASGCPGGYRAAK
jgi:hypothetical protein